MGENRAHLSASHGVKAVSELGHSYQLHPSSEAPQGRYFGMVERSQGHLSPDDSIIDMLLKTWSTLRENIGVYRVIMPSKLSGSMH